MISLDQSIPIGSIRGIDIKVHSSCLLLLVIQILSSIRFFMMVPIYFLFLITLYGPILFLTIILHELGHALTTQKLGGTVSEIILWPLGGFAICGPTAAEGVVGDLMVAAAGPLMHFPQMFTWVVLYAIFAQGSFEYFQPEVYLDLITTFSGFMSVLCAMAFYMNLFIFAFNFFIPAYPLDGGRCMAATLILLGISIRHTAFVTSITAMFVALMLLIMGMISFFAEGNPNGMFTILVAIYILVAGRNLYIMTNEGRVKEHPLFNRACYDDRQVMIENAVDNNDMEAEMTGGNIA